MNMNLKLARIKQGIKQIDFAKEINVSPATLIRWEKGIDIDKIRLGTLKKMAKLLDTTVQALFFDEEEWTKCQEHTTEMKQWNS